LRHKDYADLSGLQRLWFLSLALTDLQQAHAAYAVAVAYMRQQNVPHRRELYECFHDAIVTRYMRPFSECRLPDEKRKTRLPPHVVYGDVIPAEQALIKDMRNQIVAHSDMNNKDVQVNRLRDEDGRAKWDTFTSRSLWDHGQLERVFPHLFDRAIAISESGEKTRFCRGPAIARSPRSPWDFAA
jgi:hypothetical protein